MFVFFSFCFTFFFSSFFFLLSFFLFSSFLSFLSAFLWFLYRLYIYISSKLLKINSIYLNHPSESNWADIKRGAGKQREKNNSVKSTDIYNNITNRHIRYNSGMALLPRILSRQTFCLHSSLQSTLFSRGGRWVCQCVVGLLVCSGSASV